MASATVVVTFLGPGEPVVNHKVWLPGETREINEGLLANLVRERGAGAFAVQANADVTPESIAFVEGELAAKGKRK
jgi:hypothetical protein